MLFEYTPNQVKLTVAGHGHADKAQVKFMVRRALGVGEEVALADDASDALAIALCHLFCARVTASAAAGGEYGSDKGGERKADAGHSDAGGRKMIASLSGRLKQRDAGRVVIETGGVGYEVFIPLATYYRLPALGAPVALEIRQVVREDALTLYGFFTRAEKQAFDLLMLVQHVGPKLALAILSVLSPDELVSAIAREDVERLDAVPGVGAKVAERVVRELRDKTAELKLVAAERVEELDGAADGAEGGASELDDAVSALVNLGYKPIQARRAVDAVAARGGGAKRELEVIIRKSLAVLSGER